MAETIQLTVAAPDRQLVDEAVDHIEAPAVDGYMGVLPGHAPLLTSLGPGVLTFTKGGENTYLALDSGFMEVLPTGVRVLANGASFASEVDMEHARAELDRATDQFHEHEHEADIEAAQEAIRVAQAKLEAYQRSKK